MNESKNEKELINGETAREMLQQRLHRMNQLFKSDGHDEVLQKGEELLKKAKQNRYMIGFCGHFSAGKSTLINQLLGEKILPSHPIPTSANIVKIFRGEAYVKVYFKEKDVLLLKDPDDLEQIQDYCRDGDTVTEIEISHPRANLPEDVVFVDTPGVDSTDDAHRVATESSLHLVDFIVYMMDYHHVQSEVNYSFLKQVTKTKQDCLVVVNQIDKHLETEVPFSKFRDQVEASLVDHDIRFSQLFFVSAKVHDAPHNELQSLKTNLESAIAAKEEKASANLVREGLELLQQHKNWLKDKERKQLNQYHEILAPYTMKDEQALRKEWNECNENLLPIDDYIEQFEEEFADRLEIVLQNANLMPYHTRNLARDFLESQQLTFKINGLFSRKKTRLEKERRRIELFNELKENAKTYLDIHIKDLLFKLVQEYQMEDETLYHSFHQFAGNIDEKIITTTTKRGAMFTHEYVLNYCQSVIEAVRTHYRKAAAVKLEEAIEVLKKSETRRRKELASKRDELETKLMAITAIKNSNEKLEEKIGPVREQLSSVIVGGKGTAGKGNRGFTFQRGNGSSAVDKKWAVDLGKRAARNKSEKRMDLHRLQEQREQTIEYLGDVIAKLKNEKGLDSHRQDLTERAQRLKDQRFIITLFGAFSAGKSSFANALIGEDLLPVSPSPTTASINQIMPPTAEHPHETVIVYFKTEDDLLQDINDALTPAELSISHNSELFAMFKKRDEILSKIAKNEQEDKEGQGNDEEKEELRDPFELLEKGQLALLKAIQLGYQEMNGELGNCKQVSIEEFQHLVAIEHKACYIEKIHLYYDCPITKQGIILVDTPGADSIYRRHTELAFSYIKESDAVLFVTYYNHAFSKADREFLIQLGRIKEYFTNDKMFFIVNAADLAENKEEVEHVVNHVEKELLRCGIRFPNIFPVSSQLGLIAKRYEKGKATAAQQQLYETKIPASSRNDGVSYSGLAVIEESLHRFTLHDLTGIAMEAVLHELGLIRDIVQGWLTMASVDETERVKRLEETILKKEQILKMIEESQDDVVEKLVLQEIHELIYYVKQWIFYRYFDEFKEIFTPSRYHEGDFQATLRKCLSEIIGFIAHDLVQEMRATSFRVEVFLQQKLHEKHYRITRLVAEESNENFFRTFREPKFDSLTFSEEMPDFTFSSFQHLLDDYKKVNDFFIEKGNQKLRDDLEEILRGPVERYIKGGRERIEQYYFPLFQKEAVKVKHSLRIQADEFFSGEIAALSVEKDTADIKNTLSFINMRVEQLKIVLKEK